MQNEEKTEAIKLVGDAMTYQLNDGEPYEFRDDFCEYSDSKKYAAEKNHLERVALRVRDAACWHWSGYQRLRGPLLG